jgi:L-alanine-DL-glutamate epimerase-like enolase superfamily enzyme
MSKIARVEIFQVDLAPKVVRSDAIQAFTKQETPIVRIWTDDGADGTGYSYTIGTGGSAVVALLRDCMAPWLLGRDPAMVEEIWKGLFFHTHANAVGATVSLALAAIDMALWDLRCKRAGAPLHVLAGGAQTRVAIYDTEGGWLNFTPQELVDHATAAREKGFRGVKVKVGASRRGGRGAIGRCAPRTRAGIRAHGRREPVFYRLGSHSPGAAL